MATNLDWGPVVVRYPDSSMRIGYYDDDDHRSRGNKAIVYYCGPPFVSALGWSLVDPLWLAPVDTHALWTRRAELRSLLIMKHDPAARRSFKSLYELSLELNFVEGLLSERLLYALEKDGSRGGRRIFISHSSSDQTLAASLAVDLANDGHEPWLDIWEIKAGESIPLKISHGIDQCDYMLVLLSPRSVTSGWVEREWSAKYWSEVAEGRIRVIPVLVENCKIPTLLLEKKYADFRSDYHEGLDDVLQAVTSAGGW